MRNRATTWFVFQVMSLYHRPGSASHFVPRHEEPSIRQQAAENDLMLEQLLSSTKQLNRAFQSVGKEVKTHNALLDRLQERADKARAALQRTVSRLSGVEGAHSVKHMWVLFLVALVVFAFIYVLLKFKGYVPDRCSFVPINDKVDTVCVWLSAENAALAVVDCLLGAHGLVFHSPC